MISIINKNNYNTETDYKVNCYHEKKIVLPIPYLWTHPLIMISVPDAGNICSLKWRSQGAWESPQSLKKRIKAKKEIEKKDKRERKKLMIFMQQMQYNAPNRFSKFFRG